MWHPWIALQKKNKCRKSIWCVENLSFSHLPKWDSKPQNKSINLIPDRIIINACRTKNERASQQRQPRQASCTSVCKAKLNIKGKYLETKMQWIRDWNKDTTCISVKPCSILRKLPLPSVRFISFSNVSNLCLTTASSSGSGVGSRDCRKALCRHKREYDSHEW